MKSESKVQSKRDLRFSIFAGVLIALVWFLPIKADWRFSAASEQPRTDVSQVLGLFGNFDLDRQRRRFIAECGSGRLKVRLSGPTRADVPVVALGPFPLAYGLYGIYGWRRVRRRRN